MGRQPPPSPPPPLVDDLQRSVLPTSTILQTGPVLIGLTTHAPGPKKQVPSQNQLKVKLMPQHMSCVTTVKESRQWRVLNIAPSVTTGTLVVYTAPADDPACRGGTLSNTCAEFDFRSLALSSKPFIGLYSGVFRTQSIQHRLPPPPHLRITVPS